ncbi:hypothetical protein FLK61_38625 [Paenalkalicoccus suaedae]|uniref:Outer membrane lipoprotein carrier protein LolA n=2 Tax=Paenalkalicoccus suaedae TaxID=2592382 RepID=A0A859FI61_9BACI|nr:hypothetical protein FLK61_38625 [Paenalkalicoccus suaedae]
MKNSRVLLSVLAMSAFVVACGNINDDSDPGEAMVRDAIERHGETDSYYERIATTIPGGHTSIFATWYVETDDGISYREDAYSGSQGLTRMVIYDGKGVTVYNDTQNAYYQFEEELPYEDRLAQSDLAAELSVHLATSELTLARETMVNGRAANHVVFSDEGERYEYWFDQETSYRIQERQVGESGDTLRTVEDYTLGINYDDDVFTLSEEFLEGVSERSGRPENWN